MRLRAPPAPVLRFAETLNWGSPVALCFLVKMFKAKLQSRFYLRRLRTSFTVTSARVLIC